THDRISLELRECNSGIVHAVPATNCSLVIDSECEPQTWSPGIVARVFKRMLTGTSRAFAGEDYCAGNVVCTGVGDGRVERGITILAFGACALVVETKAERQRQAARRLKFIVDP